MKVRLNLSITRAIRLLDRWSKLRLRDLVLRRVHRRWWPAVMVWCPGCGRDYDVTDESTVEYHQHHVGDAGRDRETLLRIIDKAHQDRDSWARAYSDAYRTGRFPRV